MSRCCRRVVVCVVRSDLQEELLGPLLLPLLLLPLLLLPLLCSGATLSGVPVDGSLLWGLRRWPWGGVGPVRFEFSEELREEAGLCVDPEHVSGETPHDLEAAFPEDGGALLHDERLDGVRDLVAHVRVGEVQAGEHHCL